MWRLLLQAGAGLATFNIGLKIARLKRMAVYLAVAAVFGLLGLGALTVAGVIALEPKLGLLWATVAVGGGLVVLAALIAFIGTREPRLPKRTPIAARIKDELGAAGAALASTRAAKAASEPREPREPKAPATPAEKRKRAINMVLIATLAGVVLGRRL